ncbi:MAG: hypothetical protein RL033_5444, partial [Pseudomonadota bacterium]
MARWRRTKNKPKRRAIQALLVTSAGVALALALWLQLGSCARTVYMEVPATPPPPSPVDPGPATPPRAANARSAVGYNLDFPGDWTGLPPFIDLMKNARVWHGSCPDSDGDCDGSSQLSLDDQGWVRSLRYKDHPNQAYDYVETVVLTLKDQPGLDGEL